MPPTDFAFDVFLSHSAKDKTVVRTLAERLRADGLRVWFDAWEIEPGESIPAKIEDGLERSRVLVLCMSAHAFGSDWTQLESGTFRFRDPLNIERRFIPLRLDRAPIKGSLAQFLYIKWQKADREQEYPKLLEACRPTTKQPETRPQDTDKQVAEEAIPLSREDAEIISYSFSPDGKRALAAVSDATIRLWNLETGRWERALRGHTAGKTGFKKQVWGVAWGPDGRRALSAGTDATVRLWDVENGRCLRVLKGHTSAVRRLAWSPDGHLALSGAFDNTIRLWDVGTGRCLRILEGHTNLVFDVAWRLNGTQILSSSEDATVRVWDVKTGECVRVLKDHTEGVLCVASSADGDRAVSGGKDGTLRLWDVEGGRCLRIFEGHTETVHSVALSTDQRLAFSGAADNTVRLWDVEGGNCLRVFEGHTASVESVAWKADQRGAFSGDYKGGIRVWDVAEFVANASASPAAILSTRDQVQYMNAKVLLVGESGAGKTGLSSVHPETLSFWNRANNRDFV
jgi:WD40 repeat protein